jgi:flagellin-like protein
MIGKSTFDDIDTGVSPVVGVILMVAVTVILAAVIGTFVLDLGGNVSQNAQAGVTFDEDVGTDVDVQLNSVQSADHIYVTSSEASSWGSAGEAALPGSGTSGYDSNYDGQYLLTTNSNNSDAEVGGVGQTVTVDSGAYSTGGTVTVVGVLDGEESVIQTYEMG